MRSKGSGSIRKIERAGRTLWEGRISAGYDPGTGKRIIKTVYGQTQREVQKKITEIVRDLDHGEYIEPVKMTVGEWMDEFLEVYCREQLKPYTVRKYEADIRNHIKPAIGAIRLQSLAAIHLQRASNEMLRSGKSPKTVRNVFGLLHRALQVAVRQGMIPFNPADRIDPVKVVKKDIHPLTETEIPRFLKAIVDDPFCNAYSLQLFAGLRSGELLGLTWNNVDLEKKEILISQQLQRRGTEQVVVPFTKSNKPRRIRLPEIAVACLKDEQLRQMKNRLRAGVFWQPSDLVFTSDVGEPVIQMTYYKHFKRIAASIGRPDLRPHDLRHTAATVAIAAGADIKSVQDLLGHASASFTLNVYAHSSEQMMQDTADRMQNFYENIKK